MTLNTLKPHQFMTKITKLFMEIRKLIGLAVMQISSNSIFHKNSK